MKCMIQIPCFNEEATLAETLRGLPRQLPGISRVEWLVINDGSTDETLVVAQSCDVDHIVSHHKNLGLAQAFRTGIETCLDLGADIIVNTDADNQYQGGNIPDLIQPILDGQAEIVIGARPIDSISQFSVFKKILQKFGSWVVRQVSGTNIPDAPSGFRAFSRHAAQQLNVFSRYTYTLETIIQAGHKHIPMTWVPVNTNQVTRPSRLVRTVPRYIFQSLTTIIRILVLYKPFRFFSLIGSTLIGLGLLLGIRFLFYFFTGDGSGHVQSLILVAILIGVGFQTIMTAFVADLLSVNRRLLEEIQQKIPSWGKKN